MYRFETGDSFATRIALYTQDLSARAGDSLGSRNARIAWYCPQNATYFVKVWSSVPASYSFLASAFDSTQYRYSVTVPAEGAVFGPGDTCMVTWTAPIPMFGTVDLFLYRGTDLTTIQANVTNTGTYRWIIPVSQTAARGCRIKVSNHEVSEVFGMSGTFSIGN